RRLPQEQRLGQVRQPALGQTGCERSVWEPDEGRTQSQTSSRRVTCFAARQVARSLFMNLPWVVRMIVAPFALGVLLLLFAFTTPERSIDAADRRYIGISSVFAFTLGIIGLIVYRHMSAKKQTEDSADS